MRVYIAVVFFSIFSLKLFSVNQKIGEISKSSIIVYNCQTKVKKTIIKTSYKYSLKKVSNYLKKRKLRGLKRLSFFITKTSFSRNDYFRARVNFTFKSFLLNNSYLSSSERAPPLY